jgi:hypothetical protein
MYYPDCLGATLFVLPSSLIIIFDNRYARLSETMKSSANDQLSGLKGGILREQCQKKRALFLTIDLKYTLLNKILERLQFA